MDIVTDGTIIKTVSIHSHCILALRPFHCAGGEAAAPSRVRFVAWQRGQPAQASSTPASSTDGSGTALTVPLPIPYALPPHKYRAAGDTPWAVDTPWPGQDSYGCTIDRPHGAFYGLLESMEWADV